jgi:hypothetical protein
LDDQKKKKRKKERKGYKMEIKMCLFVFDTRSRGEVMDLPNCWKSLRIRLRRLRRIDSSLTPTAILISADGIWKKRKRKKEINLFVGLLFSVRFCVFTAVLEMFDF